MAASEGVPGGARSCAVRVTSCSRGMLEAHPANTMASSAESRASLRRAGRGAQSRRRSAQEGSSLGHVPAVEPDPPLQFGRVSDGVGIAKAGAASVSTTSARSTAPASRWACAADNRRSARRSLSGLSSAERSKNAAAAACPPRLLAACAAASTWAATPSSGPPAATARCLARGTASIPGSHAAARARWA